MTWPRRRRDDDAATCATLKGKYFHACVESLRRMRGMGIGRTYPVSLYRRPDQSNGQVSSVHLSARPFSSGQMFLNMFRNMPAGILSVGHVRLSVQTYRTCLSGRHPAHASNDFDACVEALNCQGRARRLVIVAATARPRRRVSSTRGFLYDGVYSHHTEIPGQTCTLKTVRRTVFIVHVCPSVRGLKWRPIFKMASKDTLL